MTTGYHPEAPPALGGFRVLELADETGHYAGKLLADMGAEVVKIEQPGGDPTRHLGPFLGGEPHPDRSLSFLYHNLNKRGITLNLERSAGQDLFRWLAARADVLIETTRPGTLERLGLGYPDLAQMNPGLIMASITPFGQTGPHRDRKGSDLIAMATGGLMAVTGEPDGPPTRLVGDQAYLLAGAWAAYGTVLALFGRTATGQGQHIDVSLQEAVGAAICESGAARYLDARETTQRNGALRKAAFPYGAFPAKDGYVSIGAVEMHHWDTLTQWVAEVTGNPAITDPVFRLRGPQRVVYADVLKVLIEEMTTQRTMEELYLEGQRRRIPIAPISTPAVVAGDAQLRARGFFIDVNHPDTGPLTYPGAPYHFSATPWRVQRPAPRMGEHNAAIYGELGLLPEELASLRAQGVI